MILSRADYTAWESYVQTECARFYEHTAGETYIFSNTPAAERYMSRAEKRGASSEEAAFSGPWHVVRKLVTTEFLYWVEEYLATERLTPSQWAERQRAARQDVAWEESADRALDKLDMLRRLTAERDDLIADAATKGATKTAIAAAVGITRQQVHVILARLELDAGGHMAPVTPISAAPGAAAADAVPAIEPATWATAVNGDVWGGEPF